MEWLSAENVVAVGTAVLGIVASAGMVWYERRVPRRKRVGYRVQMDNPIGDDVRSGRANRRLGLFLFDGAPDTSDATLVLLRIENDGSQGIDRDDYTSPERHGLTAVFTDRTVRGVSVTQPTDTDHLLDHFTAERGFGYEGNTLRIPRVPLNRGDHFKLLVLLSGGDVGREIRIVGGIREGEVHPNRSATPDDKPPLFSRASRLITIMLTVCVVTLAAIVVARDDTPPPIGCEKGALTVTGSTAFEPVMREVAKRYEEDCAGATVTVDPHGSTAGVRELAATGAQAKGQGSPPLIALSDGPKPADMPELRENRIALSVFALVVNDDVGLTNLSTADVRRLYQGEITNWRQLGGRSLPVHLVSRDANSGTRQVFQRRVLGRGEMANSSVDCVHKDYPTAPVTRCELDSTDQVLTEVAQLPGAIGYSELNLATRAKGLHVLSLDTDAPSVDAIEHGHSPYPYREIEYAYTYGQPPANSLASSFLTYLSRGSGQEIIRTHGHVPCWTPEGMKLCA
ncbi:substrate-binding domain-containing protein [Streptomyces diastatochromogenes]|uniref:Phosphate ABC transporter substrate-binding protein n=1 Tax=Streptomyces diastatochromogenes TaxID=42236 RepID=A0A233SPI8_STRDA|nr:substrate-binding domain-containing protein [Streptomyces diastatochromogenes]MCZ0987869.1 substrate-binding domain-containing protein [Streptomyces diastatochromogenes]OXY97573.1 phosphate ABC transporter substrate-binding protein [Streptomyces diastatochromogenes]